MLELTFNPGLTLNSFRTTRPLCLTKTVIKQGAHNPAEKGERK